MDGDGLMGIGELARRAGVTVKTVRYYSDLGLVPSAQRSAAGYRRYRTEALARLELVRTLRELGLELAVVRQVLEREGSLPEVARAHAEALDVQIRALRSRRAVLRAVAERGTDPKETATMHRLVRLSAEERRLMIEEFVNDTFGTADANPELVALVRTVTPELPEDPDPGQVAAWAELAALTADRDFRASVRRMAAYQAAQRAEGDRTGLHHELTEQVVAAVNGALAAGTEPGSPAAGEVVAGLTARYALTFGRPDDPELRRWILERLEVAADPRVERYWELVARINGWPQPPVLAPVLGWFAAALRRHGAGQEGAGQPGGERPGGERPGAGAAGVTTLGA